MADRDTAEYAHHEESVAIRRIRDTIMHEMPKLKESPSFAVLHGKVTNSGDFPDNPLITVPLWYLFGMTSHPQMDTEDDVGSVVPPYKSQDVRHTFFALLCHLSVTLTEGDHVMLHGNPSQGAFRRENNGGDFIRRFGTDALLALPFDEVEDGTSVALTTASHEIRHAWDYISEHWSTKADYVTFHEDREQYFKNPQEIRARVTELAHQAEDVIHSLVETLSDADYADGALRVLTEIFGSGKAVFSSWLYGLLTPFNKGAVEVEGDPILPRPTLDLSLLQTILRLTAGAYAKTGTREQQEHQKKVQDWMAHYATSIYNELVSQYKDKLPSSVFHGDQAKTKSLWDLAHRNIASLRAGLHEMAW